MFAPGREPLPRDARGEVDCAPIGCPDGPHTRHGWKPEVGRRHVVLEEVAHCQIELAYQRPERGDARGDLVALDLGDKACRYSDASRDLADTQTLPLALRPQSRADVGGRGEFGLSGVLGLGHLSRCAISAAIRSAPGRWASSSGW